uniref:Si:dkeyp-38g8.5 n=1 Tax=Poecilia reticulata TaxID=8081 RepID=A0A3P9MXY9_POERE
MEKLSNKEIENFVKLRASNSYLFSGLRNSSKWAWRAILKHMGLHHRMTHRQASKKFENLKKRYKELKNPPPGVKVVPQSWPFFSLMDDAMEGRLQSSAPVLKALPNNSNVSDFLIAPTRKRRKVSNTGLAESEEVNGSIQDVDISTNCEPQERKSEQLLVQREKPYQDVAALDRERALLERERAATERERAVMERERAVMERERAVMEREKLMLEKDRDALRCERLTLEKEKAKWLRLLVQKERAEEVTEDDSKVMNSDAVDKRERVLSLLEKLAENI